MAASATIMELNSHPVDYFKPEEIVEEPEEKDSKDEESEEDVQARLQHKTEKVQQHWLIDSAPFNLVISSVVLVNVLQMGAQLDLPQYDGLWHVMENFFTAVFLLEMIAKLVVLQLNYFLDKANWLDMSIVFLSVADCWVIRPLGGESGLQKLSIFRFLRLFRFVRLAKLVKQVQPLVVVMSGVVEAVISTFWVSLVLLISVYIGGIFCTEYIGNNGHVYPGYSTDPDSINELEIISEFNPYLCFGDLPKSMLTLFSISISGEWAEVVRPVAVKQPLMVFFFMFFVMFVTFGVMNVIVGMIVDNVFKSGVQLQVDAVNNERANKKKILKRLQRSLQCVVKDDLKTGIRLDDLRKSLELREVSELLDGVQLPDHMAAQELFYMLDCDGDGILQYHELKTNFLRLVDSNEFQQLCLLQTGINHIKSLVLHAESNLKTHVEEHIHGLSNDLRKHLLGAHGSTGQVGSANSAPDINETGRRDKLEHSENIMNDILQDPFHVDSKDTRPETTQSSRCNLRNEHSCVDAYRSDESLQRQAMGQRALDGSIHTLACDSLHNVQRLDNEIAAAVQECRHKIDVDIPDRCSTDALRENGSAAFLPSNRSTSESPKLSGDSPQVLAERAEAVIHLGESNTESNQSELDWLEIFFDDDGQLGLKFDQSPPFSVTDLKPGGQASMLGIRLGDRIAQVNGVSTHGWTFSDARAAVLQRPLRLKILRKRGFDKSNG